MDVKKLLSNMGILALFTFGIMAFIVTTQLDNNVTNPITNNTYINESYGELAGNLTGLQGDSQSAIDVFGNETPTQQYGELETKTIVFPTKTIRTMTLGLWNILVKLPMVILGVSPIVASLVSAIIIILLIIGIWAIWKGAIQ